MLSGGVRWVASLEDEDAFFPAHCPATVLSRNLELSKNSRK